MPPTSSIELTQVAPQPDNDKMKGQDEIVGLPLQDEKEIPVFDRVQINHSFLLKFTLVLSMASTIQGGFALGESGLVGWILIEKNGWEKFGYFSTFT
mmetsp:Transcript_42756/g.65710  ORF Transcript_42756/g.65710 Transcript_42756/m.65710 type:complete len:97 (-) Transcript_42756:1371-1661(-)